MPTTLPQQATRSIDPDFVAQVGAALDRDVPDMISATGGAHWGGIITAIATPPAQADARSALRNFGFTCIEDRARTVAKVARLVAGENAIVAVDIQLAAAGPPAVALNFANVPDTLVINRTRVIIRSLIGV